MWCNNMNAIKLAKSSIYHSITKHIELDMHFIRDKVLAKELKINYILSKEYIIPTVLEPNSMCVMPLELEGAIKGNTCCI